MNARDRRRKWSFAAAAVAAAGVLGSGTAPGQAPADGRTPVNAPKAAKSAAKAVKPASPEAAIEVKTVRVPVNPGDAVAIVNGKPITRQRLADEAIVRKGEEVLDALISRELIEQAIVARKLTVTAQEIDAEVDRVVQNIGGVSREEWFRNLAKERKITPAQYKNDIIYPGLALKKLAQNRVQVTEKDMKDAYEAHYGEKLKCRIIMCLREADAVQIWEELKKNPGGFAHIAKNDNRSVDQATKPMGGLLEQLMTRHAHPRNVSDAAFLQLVDGDPDDHDASHKPKDGDITGPIQVTESTWVIMKREGLLPAQNHDPKDAATKAFLKNLIFEAKLKEAMSEVFEELVKGSEVENRLTGQVKLAHEENHPDHRVDGDVKLMSQPAASNAPTAGASPARAKGAASAVKPEDRATFEALKKRNAASAPK